MAEKRADEKIGLEIEEKLKEAEENGTDVIRAFQLGKLYYQYLDYDNAILWFKKAAEMGSAAKRSKAGGSTRSRCDRIKFDLFYTFYKEYYDSELDSYRDDFTVDELRMNGRPHDLATNIYINGKEITEIVGMKWLGKWDYYAHLCPWQLLDNLINKRGFMGDDLGGRTNMPVWKDGGIVRNILRPCYIEDYDANEDNHFLMVSEKEDDKFIYWRIMNPSEIKDPHWSVDEDTVADTVTDTSGKNDLFFKFAKEQYYAELAKLAKLCDKPEPNKTMWVERLTDILVNLATRKYERLVEDEDRVIAAETDGNKAYEKGRRMYYEFRRKDNKYFDEYSGYFFLPDSEYVARALKWFYKAAVLGNTDAMLCIGACILLGYTYIPHYYCKYSNRAEKVAMGWLEEARKLGSGPLLQKHLPPLEREDEFDYNLLMKKIAKNGLHW